ncbi:hypothetical protein [Metabacillus fastidiosus]|uniref:hypothetical protein n=1 Tax=Metabacillus fastidiosus TaxID=1458 RepID=UPI003D289D67
MVYYAQLDINNRVVAISQLSDKVNLENMIDISDLEPKPQLGSVYDPLTQQFSEPVITDPSEPIPNAADIQMQTLLNTEYLVIMSELNNL